MAAPTQEQPTHPDPSLDGEQLVRDLEAAHDARPHTEGESWLSDRWARLDDWRSAAHKQLGIESYYEEYKTDDTEVTDATPEQEGPVGSPAAKTIEAADSPKQKPKLREVVTGVHMGRVVMSRVSARMAQRHERLSQPQSPEKLRKRRTRKAAAVIGALATTYLGVKYFDLPPLAISSAAMTRSLSRSPNVTASGAAIEPGQQEAALNRFNRAIERRKERKRLRGA